MSPSDPMTPGATAPVPPAQPKVSVWEDLVDIFFSPVKVFQRRRVNGNFWIPLLVVTLVAGIGAYANRGVMQPIFDAEFQRQSAAAMKANPQITPEMMETGRAFAATIAQVGTVVAMPILIVLTAFLAWLVAKFFDATLTWGAAMVVAAYAAVPRILQTVLISVQGLLIDPSKMVSQYSIQIGPARFLDANTSQPMLGALFERLEIFSLWGILLITIGVVVCGGMSKSKAWLFFLVYWLVGLHPRAVRGLAHDAGGRVARQLGA